MAVAIECAEHFLFVSLTSDRRRRTRSHQAGTLSYSSWLELLSCWSESDEHEAALTPVQPAELRRLRSQLCGHVCSRSGSSGARYALAEVKKQFRLVSGAILAPEAAVQFAGQPMVHVAAQCAVAAQLVVRPALL